ncbi:hypothetical protein CYLTODRAFT_372312 [Cylindrobasidium torrendii FP15055 ss-10]|uniref:Uncharacterized protein n=1 Tax=Cylindrobasidium torrendii FP15055 ss-10 TaxID=1314674 RepID=A0A0D7BGK4_9AGAR|nr:hypothetical protein CYLTODRAFT_372312 [Cylindrobasidium torrendii FP15055 ss-10]
MASMTLARPSVSSPLADMSSMQGQAKRIVPRRNTSFPPGGAAARFPSSRPLRPFPTISSANQPGKKPVKMIQPPANQRCSFVLDLTQAELSRQD